VNRPVDIFRGGTRQPYNISYRVIDQPATESTEAVPLKNPELEAGLPGAYLLLGGLLRERNIAFRRERAGRE